MEKKMIRREMLKKRGTVPQPKERSNEMIRQITSSLIYQETKIILAYSSIGSEVDTKPLLIQALKDKKELYLPKIIDIPNCIMEFYKIDDLNQTEEGYQGIKEPTSGIRFEPGRETALMIVPCVAFDCKGTRLGYGRGYYDRYLSSIIGNIHPMILAFREQEAELLPKEETDFQINQWVIG